MKRKNRFNSLAIVSNLIEQEKQLPGTLFVAPHLNNGKVRLRVDGIVYEFLARDCPTGWSIMKVGEKGQASFVDKASPKMIRNYLGLLPRLRMIAIDQFQEKWWSVSALIDKNQKIQIDGPVPFHLSERCSPFDTIYCRFDGTLIWFDSIDRRRDPQIAGYLRNSLHENLKPDALSYSGLMPQEKLVYRMLYLQKNGLEKAADERTSLNEALTHAGARLQSFWTNSEGNRTVRFMLDGKERVVEIESSSLSVVSAGICLSGADSDFDLTSLVGVLREADESGLLYEV